MNKKRIIAADVSCIDLKWTIGFILVEIFVADGNNLLINPKQPPKKTHFNFSLHQS